MIDLLFFLFYIIRLFRILSDLVQIGKYDNKNISTYSQLDTYLNYKPISFPTTSISEDSNTTTSSHKNQNKISLTSYHSVSELIMYNPGTTDSRRNNNSMTSDSGKEKIEVDIKLLHETIRSLENENEKLKRILTQNGIVF